MPEPTIASVTSAYRRRLLALERRAAAELARAYLEVLADLRPRLDALVAELAAREIAGETVSQAGLFRLRRYRELIGEAEVLFARYGLVAGDVTIRMQAEAAGLGRTAGGELLQAVLLEAGQPGALVGLAGGINRGAVAQLVGSLQPGSPLRRLADSFGVETSAAIRSELIRGLAAGRNSTIIGRAIAERLGGQLARAVLIARTETHRSYRTATILTMQANSDVVTGWRWVAAKQSRTCLNCLARDGSEWPLDEFMPAHPGCRCSIAPVTRFDTPERRAGRETGAQWFERQPNAVKREMMGASAFDAYQRGEVTLADFAGMRPSAAWGPTSYQRSLKAIRAGRERRAT